MTARVCRACDEPITDSDLLRILLRIWATHTEV